MSKWVSRSVVRVDADEVTCPAHVILRYRLERAMVEDKLQPDDLPQVWSETMVELFNVSPADNRRGCLQDIHWYDGAWGYFPTYAIGAIAAAQLFAAAKVANPQVLLGLFTGDFRPLIKSLGKNIHSSGFRYTTDGIFEKATGRKLDPCNFKRHLKIRYLLQLQ